MDNDQLTLPISINNDLSTWSYYSLLIYQVIVIYLLLTIASACFLSYWASIQHACSQFSIIMYVFNLCEKLLFSSNSFSFFF